MENNIILSNIPLDERINNDIVTREELKIRAKLYWETVNSILPVFIDNSYGCPICYSKLDKHNRLVREKGYTVCDYCVNYVEGYS